MVLKNLRKIERQITLLFLLTAFILSTDAHDLNRIFVDKNGNLHLLKSMGKNIQITQHGKVLNPQLAEDGKTVAWIVSDTSDGKEQVSGSNQLMIYCNGRIRHLQSDPMIRDFWFWKDGANIALDCGGEHFAGQEYLYDLRTLKKIDSINQNITPVEQRPQWANK